MKNQIILSPINNERIATITGTGLEGLHQMADAINMVLSRYKGCENVKLAWSSFDEAKGEWTEPNNLSQLVKRSQDARGMGTEGDAKKDRRAEFVAVKAVFDLENISALIEACYDKLDYQRRWTGQSKKGVGTIQFVPRDKAHKDVVGKATDAIRTEQETARFKEFAEKVSGDKSIAGLIADGITSVDELVAKAKQATATVVGSTPGKPGKVKE